MNEPEPVQPVKPDEEIDSLVDDMIVVDEDENDSLVLDEQDLL